MEGEPEPEKTAAHKFWDTQPVPRLGECALWVGGPPAVICVGGWQWFVWEGGSGLCGSTGSGLCGRVAVVVCVGGWQ